MDAHGESDVAICAKYVSRVCLYTQIERLKREKDFNFRNVVIENVDWDFNKYGGKPTDSFLAVYPTDRKMSYNVAGCEELSSFCTERVVDRRCQFPIQDYNKLCVSKKDDNIKIPYCQDGCFKSILPLDVYWDSQSGQCKLVNIAKKLFCLNPGGNNSVPPLKWDQSNNTCSINKTYCDYYGLSYENGECYQSEIASFLEKYVFGKTVIRSVQHPLIMINKLDDPKNVQFNCEMLGGNEKFQRITVEEHNVLPKEIAKTIAVVVAPDVIAHSANKTLNYLRSVVLKDLPPKLRNSILYVAIENVTVEVLFHNTVKMLTKFSRLLSSPELFLVTILTSIIDYQDYLNLDTELSTTDFRTLMQKFDKQFVETVITPEVVMYFLYTKLANNDYVDKALKLMYGDVHALIDVSKQYWKTGTVNEHMLDEKIVERIITDKFENNLKIKKQTAIDEWPIKGTLLLASSSFLLALSVYNYFVPNRLTFIILIVFILLKLVYMYYKFDKLR